MYQKCPICNGSGLSKDGLDVTSLFKSCETCHGKCIISTVDGKPPSNSQLNAIAEERFTKIETKLVIAQKKIEMLEKRIRSEYLDNKFYPPFPEVRVEPPGPIAWHREDK